MRIKETYFPENLSHLNDYFDTKPNSEDCLLH